MKLLLARFITVDFNGSCVKQALYIDSQGEVKEKKAGSPVMVETPGVLFTNMSFVCISSRKIREIQPSH
jgi:hypothetical protein